MTTKRNPLIARFPKLFTVIKLRYRKITFPYPEVRKRLIFLGFV